MSKDGGVTSPQALGLWRRNVTWALHAQRAVQAALRNQARARKECEALSETLFGEEPAPLVVVGAEVLRWEGVSEGVRSLGSIADPCVEQRPVEERRSVVDEEERPAVEVPFSPADGYPT